MGRLREKMQTAAKSRGTVKGEIKGLKSRLRKGTGTAVPVLQMHKNRLFSAGEQPERRRGQKLPQINDRDRLYKKVLTVNIPLGPLNFLRTLVDMI